MSNSSKNIQNIRSCKSLKRRLDIMIKKFPKKISIDHGVACFGFDHYVYEEPCFENDYTERITIYVEDFDRDNTIIQYMSVTDDDLRRPRKSEYGDFVSCSWDKRYPTILFMREYEKGYDF